MYNKTLLDRVSIDIGRKIIAQLKKEELNPIQKEKLPLMYACVNITTDCVDLVELLLAKGANPNARDKNDATPLMYAIGNSDPQKACRIIELLLAYQADINAVDYKGETALMRAVQPPVRSIAVIKQLLLGGADWKISDNNGDTALDLALKVNNIEAVNLLKNIINKGEL